MDKRNIKEILDHYFPQLTENELKEEIQQVGKVKRVDQGDIVIDIDEKITHLPLIFEGTINVHREDDDGNEILLYYVESGNTCAQSLTCCMSDKKSTIRAEAEEETWFISVPINYLDHWLVKYKSWKEFIMSTYAFRFEELLKTVDDLAFKKLDERLLAYLEEKAKVSGNNVLNVSHRDIAYDLNSSREVISRLLKQLENNRKISLGRGKIELLKNA
jgi:CRP/FNR family transcriptional regulator